MTTPQTPAFIALVGPTAVGKSAVALHLATKLPLEIVNGDSRQVYRHMDIGTSKPSANDRALAPHHLYDVVDPDEEFSLSDYQRYATSAMTDIVHRHRMPLIVGGSGQYIWSLVEGWQVPEVPPDHAFRIEMQTWAETYGHPALHGRLAHIDPECAALISATNVRRVIRALELHRATGERPSLLLRRRHALPRKALVIGLSLDRTTLFGKADARIDTMVQSGFPEEARALLTRGYSTALPAMSSIGYREMVSYVTGATSLDTAVALIRRETRRLIRRQHTWFRPLDERIMWLDLADVTTACDTAERMIKGAIR